MPEKPRSIASLGLVLGEGPAWDGAAQCLWLVDIKGQLLLRFDPATGTCDRWPTPGPIGWALPCRGGSVIVGMAHGIFRFEPRDGSYSFVCDPEPGLGGNRLNDATVDARGRIWLGSMDDAETEATGAIHMLASAGLATSSLPAVAITNGPAIAPDGVTIYHTDTLGRRIYRGRIEGDVIVDSAVFAEIEQGAGYPDGPTVDSEGCLWTGLFGGWGVRRYDPDGRLIEAVAFPVANVTKIAFGGPDLATAYVTTARKGLDEAALREQPLAGDLFAFDPRVRGNPLPLAEI